MLAAASWSLPCAASSGVSDAVLPPAPAAQDRNARSAVHDAAVAGRDDRQAGGRQHQRGNVRHRSEAGSRAESRRLLHEAGARRRVRRHDVSSRRPAWRSSRAAIRCRRIPAKATLYGTGGLGVLKAEISAERATRGAVAAVLQPSKPDSARRAVLHLRDGSAGARRQVHDLRPRLRRHRRRRRRSRRRRRTPRACRAERIVITAVTIRDTPPPEPEPFSTETPRGARAVSRGARDIAGADHDRVLSRQGARSTSATSCGWRSPACSTARRSIASCAASSSRRAPLNSRGAADREAAEVRAHAAARVQRHEARERDRVDGPRRRSRERDDVVLHRDRETRRRSTASTRRSAASWTACRWSRPSSRPR